MYYNRVPQTRELKQQNFIFSQFWESGSPSSRCWQGWWGLSFQLVDSASSLCPHMAFLLCVCSPGVSPSSYTSKDTCSTRLSPHLHSLITSSNFNYLLKDPISKYNHIGCWGFNVRNFGQHDLVHNKWLHQMDSLSYYYYLLVDVFWNFNCYVEYNPELSRSYSDFHTGLNIFICFISKVFNAYF